MDSFSFRPAVSRDSFVAAHLWQSDYITFNTKNIRLENIDLERLAADSTIKAGLLDICQPVLTDYRDKRRPFRNGIIKPFPVQLLRAIPVRFLIDSVQLNDASIKYTEMNNISNQEIDINLSGIHAIMFPVRNVESVSGDALKIRAEGFLMDSAWLKLGFRQSYRDPAEGLLVTLRASPVDLAVFNPVLLGMASVKLQSGFLDTMNMWAIGEGT